MPDWKGNTAFRDRALDLFALYKEFLSKDYRDMLEAKKDGQITPEEQTKIAKIQSSIAENEAKLDAALKKAQQDFAESNHMSLANKPVQEKN